MEMDSGKQRVHHLEFQNRRLSETVEVQKSELVKKERIIDEHIQRWDETQVAILAIRRTWNQLLEDVVYLGQKEGIEIPEVVIEEKQKKGPDPKFIFLDPFVKALLSISENQDRSSAKDEIMDHVSTLGDFAEDVEIELKSKSQQVNQLLGQILHSIRTHHDREKKSDQSEKDDEDDEKAGLYRALLERSRMTEDKIIKQESELNEVRNELAEIQIQLQNAQRKIVGFKQAEKLRKEQESAKKIESKGSGFNQESRNEGEALSKEKNRKVSEIEHKWFDELVKRKTEELEKEKQDHLKTQHELRSLENSFKDENWVLTSQVYRSMVEQRDQLLTEVEKKRREIDKLHYAIQCKDRDLSKKKLYDPEGRQATIDALHDAQKKMRELKSQLIENEKALMEKDSHMDGSLSVKTFDELNCLVKSSKEEAARLKKQLKEREPDNKLEEARVEAKEAEKKLKTLEIQVDHLKEALKEAEAARNQHSLREKQLYNAKEDLKVFVDVLSTCDVVEKHWKESEARARERNILRENTSLKRKIAEFEKPENGDLLKKLESSQRKVHRLVDERDHMRAEKGNFEQTLKHHEEDLKQLKQLRAALEVELEETGAAYEDIQAQNMRLLATMKAKETEMMELKHQKAKLAHRNGVLSMEVENSQNEIKMNKRLSHEMETLKTEYLGKLADLQSEMMVMKDQLEFKQGRHEDVQEKLLKKEVEVKQLRHEFEAVQKTANEKRKALEIENELRLNERNKRQRIESEAKMIENFKDKMRSGSAKMTDFDGSQEIELLNKEIKEMRRCLTCSICSTRRKSTILVKCMHTFCRKCIDDSIEKRRRRCPGCATPFSKEEVKPFYLS